MSRPAGNAQADQGVSREAAAPRAPAGAQKLVRGEIQWDVKNIHEYTVYLSEGEHQAIHKTRKGGVVNGVQDPILRDWNQEWKEFKGDFPDATPQMMLLMLMPGLLRWHVYTRRRKPIIGQLALRCHYRRPKCSRAADRRALTRECQRRYGRGRGLDEGTHLSGRQLMGAQPALVVPSELVVAPAVGLVCFHSSHNSLRVTCRYRFSSRCAGSPAPGGGRPRRPV